MYKTNKSAKWILEKEEDFYKQWGIVLSKNLIIKKDILYLFLNLKTQIIIFQG